MFYAHNLLISPTKNEKAFLKLVRPYNTLLNITIIN